MEGAPILSFLDSGEIRVVGTLPAISLESNRFASAGELRDLGVSV